MNNMSITKVVHTVPTMESNVHTFSFSDMQRMASAIAKSGLFGLKTEDQALSLMMLASSEGKHPAIVARDYNIINGKPAKTSEAILRDFQASGGTVKWLETSDKKAVAMFSHPSAESTLTVDWDMERAKQAQLDQKENWRKYPRAMLRARVISEGCRAQWPGSTSGMYTPEEVQDFTDAGETVVSINTAVSAAVEQLNEESEETIKDRLETFDVPTLDKLQKAYNEAYRSTTNEKTRERYKQHAARMRADIIEAIEKDKKEQAL